MANQVTGCLALFCLLSTVYCGEITVAYSPTTVRFGSADVLRATDLDDVLAASLGYTPVQSSLWKGLTITSPFSVPSAAVIVEIHGGGASIRQEGSTYGLKEDTTMDEIFHRLKTVYGSRAQRRTLFKHITVDDKSSEGESAHYSIPAAKTLEITVEPDATFLREMAALMITAQTAEEITTTPHGGQDVIFLEVKSLAQLVKTYGLESPQVAEAGDILRTELAKITDFLRHIYSDRVLVVSATVDQLDKLSRKTRSVPVSEKTDLNLASEYSADYPAMFNIILWLSIVLAFSILATSVAMATMDPGRDSIIYRMTNPRMKKDN